MGNVIEILHRHLPEFGDRRGRQDWDIGLGVRTPEITLEGLNDTEWWMLLEMMQSDNVTSVCLTAYYATSHGDSEWRCTTPGGDTYFLRTRWTHFINPETYATSVNHYIKVIKDG